MVNRRHAITVAAAAALVLSTGLSAQKKEERKQSDAQKKEIVNAVKIVDEVAAGQPAPNDFGLTWTREDMIKAANNMEYVPFTVTIAPAKANGNLAIYWRVVSKAAAEAPPAKKDDKKRADYPYEDVSFVAVKAGPEPTRISRSFTVPAGAYEVFVAVKEPTSDKKNAPAPRVSILRQSVTVPDFWNGDLSTSSVMVTQRIDPLPAPLTNQQLIERPYALGTMEVLPAWDTKLSKKSELSTFFMIYNARADAANKPDVTVEYNFYAKEGGGEKFFNKTSPQSLNAQTLPPEFDLAAGHQLQSGQAVPLASFPEGDYRLEIKVTDKIGNRTLTKDVNFTVNPS